MTQIRKLVYEQEARNKLLKGAEIMYRAVCTTLGPKGRNVAIGREWGVPIIVHDGVTVSRDVWDKDEFVNMGINLIREAAQKTNDEAGDGTTTSILLAYFLIKYGMEEIEKSANPMVLRREIQGALKDVLRELKNISMPVKNDEEVARIAHISSADREIGELVAEAVRKVGRDGSISVDSSKTDETYVEFSEGMQIDHGWKNINFITNEKTMESVIKDASVVVVGKKMTTQIDIVPLLEALLQKTKNIVIFGDVDGMALRIALSNKMQGVFNILIVDPPGYEDRRTNLMEDIAIATGGTVVKDEIGLPMEQFVKQFDISSVGYAKKVIASRKKTVIIDGGRDTKEIKKALKERADTIRQRLKIEDNPYEKEKLEERLAKLTTGVAVIRVGAKTDIEQREKMERVKDAVGAAQAAVEEGIVAGGGITFRKLKNAQTVVSQGSNILYRVLDEPIRKIFINAGEDEKNFHAILTKIDKRGGNFGYDMEDGEIVDMVKEGIIDPTKVVRLSLQNAVSVSCMILTTDCLNALEDKKDYDKES